MLYQDFMAFYAKLQQIILQLDKERKTNAELDSKYDSYSDLNEEFRFFFTILINKNFSLLDSELNRLLRAWSSKHEGLLNDLKRLQPEIEDNSFIGMLNYLMDKRNRELNQRFYAMCLQAVKEHNAEFIRQMQIDTDKVIITIFTGADGDDDLIEHSSCNDHHHPDDIFCNRLAEAIRSNSLDRLYSILLLRQAELKDYRCFPIVLPQSLQQAKFLVLFCPDTAGFTHLTPAIFNLVETLNQFSQLQSLGADHLIVFDNIRDDPGLRQSVYGLISLMARNKNNIELHLDGNYVVDDAIAAIMTEQGKIKKLWLRNHSLTAAGIETLFRSKSLQELYIDGTNPSYTNDSEYTFYNNGTAVAIANGIKNNQTLRCLILGCGADRWAANSGIISEADLAIIADAVAMNTTLLDFQMTYYWFELLAEPDAQSETYDLKSWDQDPDAEATEVEGVHLKPFDIAASPAYKRIQDYMARNKAMTTMTMRLFQQAKPAAPLTDVAVAARSPGFFFGP